jgi:hypothetical protein
MKKLTLMLSLFVGISLALSTSASGQSGRSTSRAQVCVYENNFFGGWQQCFNQGDEIPDLGSHRGKISSIRLYGDARVIIFADKDFRGASMDVASDLNDLAQTRMTTGIVNLTWNDQIESLRVIPARFDSRRDDIRDNRDSRDNRDNRDSGYSRGRQDAVCIYQEPNYRGRFQCYDSGDEVANLPRNGNWGNRISSIRVYGPSRVTLYRQIDFRGDRITINRDVPDLRQLRLEGRVTWDNQVSSIDINGGRGRAYGRDYRR